MISIRQTQLHPLSTWQHKTLAQKTQGVVYYMYINDEGKVDEFHEALTGDPIAEVGADIFRPECFVPPPPEEESLSRSHSHSHSHSHSAHIKLHKKKGSRNSHSA